MYFPIVIENALIGISSLIIALYTSLAMQFIEATEALFEKAQRDAFGRLFTSN